MRDFPRPAGWKGGSTDFTFVRTLDGHISAGPFSYPELAEDIECHRNERTMDDANFDSEDYMASHMMEYGD